MAKIVSSFGLFKVKENNIEVEPLKSTVQVKGTGPYKWI